MSGPLISVASLRDRMGDPDLRIVDCRWYLGDPSGGRTAYEAGHLPRASFASLDDDLSADTGAGRHPLPSREHFAAVVVRLGIGAATPVAVYDDRGGAIAARLWWMLSQQGHGSVFVLDGGIQAWEATGLPLTTAEPNPPPGTFTIEDWTGTVDAEMVRARATSTLLVDVRSPERYAGIEEPVDPKPGHIPGARSVPLSGSLDHELHMLPMDRLRDHLEANGITSDRKVIAHCGSGVTACHLVLAAEAAGLPRPDLYVGSWSEWSSRDLPVATGFDP